MKIPHRFKLVPFDGNVVCGFVGTASFYVADVIIYSGQNLYIYRLMISIAARPSKLVV